MSTEIFGISYILIFKAVAILPLLLHLAFSIVLVRQTKLMTMVVEAHISSAIILISYVHLLFSVFVLLWLLFIV